MATATPSNTSTATPTAVEDNSPTPNTPKDGLQVYQEQYCGLCHQLDSAGTLGRFGPPHNGIATTTLERLSNANYSGSATTPAEYIRESILTPDIYIVDGFTITSHKMPAYTHLSNAEVDALVQFLLNQK